MPVECAEIIRGSKGHVQESVGGRGQRRVIPPKVAQGFSLLEMMAVIDLILIMASFSLPMYHSVVVRGREAVLREDLFTLRCQIDRFTHDNERGPASLDELVEKEYMGTVPHRPLYRLEPNLATGNGDHFTLRRWFRPAGNRGRPQRLGGRFAGRHAV
ncbi:MAG: type II secretion system protein [Terriglobia bacterium]